MTLTIDHLSEELFGCLPEERHAAHQELIEDDAHSPPVYWLPIALSQDHLWGNVLWGPTHLQTQTEGNRYRHIIIEVCFGERLRLDIGKRIT